MHDIIENGLEDYLSGSASDKFRAHLAECASCRTAVEEIGAVSTMLASLRDTEPVEVPLGFSARTINNIRDQRSRSFWSLLAMESAFTRKLAVASLLGLAVLGSYLATDSDTPANRTPEAVFASHDVHSNDNQQHLDGMLVTLATYRQ